MNAIQLNASDIKVEWNRNNLKEVEEAKTLYRKARAENREIVDLVGAPITAFRAYLESFLIKEISLRADQFSMRILDETGDRRLIWNATDPAQVKDAATLFNEYIQKGWKAYMVDDSGKQGRRVYGFDADNQELLFDEKSNREKLAAFVAKESSMRKMTLLPKTRPG